jgi:predicted translin family RNA/ssDNA-binding protein
MKSPALFSQMSKRYSEREDARRELIRRSNEALSKSKRAIFALHRDDFRSAEKLLTEADALFQKTEARFKKIPDLEHEGSYRAGLEEYAEALLFASYLETGKLGKINDRVMEPSIYLAGLSDTTGEIVRYAMRQATCGNTKAVEESREVVAMVIESLLDMDLTGYLRTKFDQAKKNLRRLEEMAYDLSLRER